MPKVSVIIPVYNVEKYLKECLNSVINQTLREIEIILVDDGSTDKCPQICDEYKTSKQKGCVTGLYCQTVKNNQNFRLHTTSFQKYREVKACFVCKLVIPSKS
ncbi:MAG: glycosyltransferase [Oscillospiraceae bacterium]|nr:glycosyltransferase [Oscillospiraceae bacterium]